MSIKQIIKESMEKNPLGLKEALEEELRSRVALALEAKKSRFDLEESFQDYSHSSMEESVNSSDVPFDREYKSLIQRFETEINWDSVSKAKDGASTVIIAKKNDTKYYISFFHPEKQRKLLITGWRFVDVSVGSLYLGKKYFTKTGDKIENKMSKSGRRPIDWLNAYKEMVSDGTIKENIREAETALQKLKSHVNNQTKLEEELEDFMMGEDFEQLDEATAVVYKNKETGEVYYKEFDDALQAQRAQQMFSKRDYASNVKIGTPDRMKLVVKGLKNKKLAKESFDLSDLTLEELEDFMVSEDFDQLDEISKNTLASYVKKASSQASKDFNTYGTQKRKSSRLASRAMASGTGTANRADYDKEAQDAMDKGNAAMKRYDKRAAGIDRAKDRLAK